MQTHSSLSPSSRRSRSLRVMAAASLLGLAVAIPVWSSRSVGSGLSLAQADVPAAAQEDENDDQAASRQVLRDNCLICHSEELLSGQRLTPPQWKSEVEKMVGMGAPLNPDQVEPLIDFLAEHYSDTTPPVPPARMTYAEALESVKPDPPGSAPLKGDAERGATLYAANCATCHGPTGQGFDLGPNLVEVAVLLRQAEFREVTRNGKRRMPGFKTILNPDQESDILVWLRTKRYQGLAAK